MNKLIVLILIVMLFLTGCADSMTFEQAAVAEQAGFWFGLWNGITFPFAWVGSLFADSIAVYAINNNGGWYDFGFFLGLGGFSTGVGISS